MTIQWSLVLFTVLAGMGAWTIATFALATVGGKRPSDKTGVAVAAVSLALIVVGGLASVTHLAHPDRIMGVLGHPTAGIFTEAAFVGVMSLLLIILLVMIKRGASAKAIKTLTVVTGIIGVVFSFMLGYSYMMPSRAHWNTLALPLTYLGTAAATGTALYAAIATSLEGTSDGKAALWVIVGGVLASATACVYGLQTGVAMGENALPFWVGVVLCGGVGPVVCGALARRKRDNPMSYYVIAAVLALVGSLAFRALMWAVGSGINLFGLAV